MSTNDSPTQTAAFTQQELEAAVMWSGGSVGRRVITSSWGFSEGVIGHLQRRGLLRIQVVDYPKGKPLFADVSLTERAREALS